MDERGNTSPGYEALRGALGRIVGSLPVGSPGSANVTPARAVFLTSVEKARSLTASAFLPTKSPVTTASNVRMVTSGGGNANPSPVAVDFGQGEGETSVRREHLADLERKDRQAKNLPDPSFDDLLNSLQIAGRHIGRGMEDGAHETRGNTNAGNFHYLPSSHYQESPGIVPDRFHVGRESLSVVQNITMRDSKRTKARAKDDDYKRRVSISSRIGAHATNRSPSESIQPFQRARQGPRSSMAAGSGIFPSPDPAHGGVGFQHGSSVRHKEHSRHLFEEGPSPVFPPGGGRRNFNSVVEGVSPPDAGKFDITLSYEGNRVHHQVAEHMPVAQLSAEAAAIFQINAPEVILLLYGIIPRTLPRDGRISDPPRIVPGSTVLVFFVTAPGHGPGGYQPPASPNPRARDGKSFIPDRRFWGIFNSRSLMGTHAIGRRGTKHLFDIYRSIS
jgi:hypothetical protein